jgi:broad specificity phosphatase PhoE
MNMRAVFNTLGLVAIFVAAFGGEPAKANERLWQLLKTGEAFAMMRHALAPGTGDPSNFRVGDCSTQRNLNDVGRQQARTIGAAFRSNGIDGAEVLTSQWCRCRETASNLGLGPTRDLPALNSFFQAMEKRDDQTAELKRWLREHPQTTPRVLVTHQVNISALTGEFTRSGEIIVASLQPDGGVKVHGSLTPF